MLERDYGVLIKTRELGEKVFMNLGTLAQSGGGNKCTAWMKPRRAFITGVGVVSAAGTGWRANLSALSSEQRRLQPLTSSRRKTHPPWRA